MTATYDYDIASRSAILAERDRRSRKFIREAGIRYRVRTHKGRAIRFRAMEDRESPYSQTAYGLVMVLPERSKFPWMYPHRGEQVNTIRWDFDTSDILWLGRDRLLEVWSDIPRSERDQYRIWDSHALQCWIRHENQLWQDLPLPL